MSTFNDKTLALEYARRSDEMPKEPQTILFHPASVNLELLTSLLRDAKEKVRHANCSCSRCFSQVVWHVCPWSNLNMKLLTGLLRDGKEKARAREK